MGSSLSGQLPVKVVPFLCQPQKPCLLSICRKTAQEPTQLRLIIGHLGIRSVVSDPHLYNDHNDSWVSS